MGFPGQRAGPRFWPTMPRKPRRKRRSPVAQRDLPGIADALTVQLVAAATGAPVHEVAADLRRRPSRPETYDHPLAVAARLGRGFALTHIGLVDPADPAQLRAFEVARARSRARRWGWRSATTAAGAGRGNRGQRRRGA